MKYMQDALDLIEHLRTRIKTEDRWNVWECADNHSRAWHGAFILQNAADWIRDGVVDAGVYNYYQPIFTREHEVFENLV